MVEVNLGYVNEVRVGFSRGLGLRTKKEEKRN